MFSIDQLNKASNKVPLNKRYRYPQQAAPVQQQQPIQQQQYNPAMSGYASGYVPHSTAPMPTSSSFQQPPFTAQQQQYTQ